MESVLVSLHDRENIQSTNSPIATHERTLPDGPITSFAHRLDVSAQTLYGVTGRSAQHQAADCAYEQEFANQRTLLFVLDDENAPLQSF